MLYVIKPAGQILTVINFIMFLQKKKNKIFINKKMNGMFKMPPLANELYFRC